MFKRSIAGLLLPLLIHCGEKPEPSQEQQSLPVVENDDQIPLTCGIEKSHVTFANSVVQTLYGRDLSEGERRQAEQPEFNREAFVDAALNHQEADYGFSLFLSNLFQLSAITVNTGLEDEALIADTTLVAQLRQEPIELFLRNKDKPWPWFFTTREIYCTKETAPLYDFPLYEGNGFSRCTLPDNRAGFLGLASVLRAVPSDFVSVNNNYKRVAFALYLAQGVRLLAATNGPRGEGPGDPLAPCVPVTDIRQDPGGLSYGTAMVPMEGATCASCHSPHNGPLSVAFRHFREDGSTFTIRNLEELNNEERHGQPPELLTEILNESESCWAPTPGIPPRPFAGQPGLSRLIVQSGTLATALSVQIAASLGNLESTIEMSQSIRQSYETGGQTLQSAIRGYFLSQTFQCAQVAD